MLWGLFGMQNSAHGIEKAEAVFDIGQVFDRLNKLETSNAEKTKIIHDLQTAVTSQQNDLASLAQSMTIGEQRIAKLESDMATEKEARDALSATIRDFISLVQQSVATLTGKINDLLEMQAANPDSTDALNALRDEINAEADILKTLKIPGTPPVVPEDPAPTDSGAPSGETAPSGEAPADSGTVQS